MSLWPFTTYESGPMLDLHYNFNVWQKHTTVGAVIPVSYSCMEKFKLPVASFYNLTVFDIFGIFGKSYCWLEFKLNFFDFKQSSAAQHASVMMDPGKCL